LSKSLHEEQKYSKFSGKQISSNNPITENSVLRKSVHEILCQKFISGLKNIYNNITHGPVKQLAAKRCISTQTGIIFA
jgi:hypothetical protein